MLGPNEPAKTTIRAVTQQVKDEGEKVQKGNKLADERRERLQKDHNDKMMVVITAISVVVAFAAVGVSYWAARDTSESAKQSLELQSKSIDAQILNMQNDERPYLAVEVDGTEQARFSDAEARGSSDNAAAITIRVPRLRTVLYGRTPATSVENHEDCTLFTDDGGREFPDPRPSFIMIGTIFQGQKPEVSCISGGRMPIGTTLAKTNLVRLDGFLRYMSLSGGTYTTPYCYEYFPSSQAAPKTCTVKPPS